MVNLLHVMPSVQVLNDFGIKKHNIAGCTYDKGGDISKASREELCTLSECLVEWCVCHMLNRVMVDAFGISEDRRKSKNKEARVVCDLVTKTVESLKKSKPNMQRLAELQAALREAESVTSNKFRKVVNHAAHRWGSVDRVFGVVLNNWDLIKAVFEKSKNVSSWGLEFKKEEVSQFYYILTRIRAFMTASQGSETFISIGGFFQLFSDLKEPYLVVVSTKPKNALDNLPSKRKTEVECRLRCVEESELPPVFAKKEEEKRYEVVGTAASVAVKVKTMAEDGLFKRFFHRYSAFHAFKANKRCFKKLVKRGTMSDAKVKKTLERACARLLNEAQPE